MVYFGEFLTKVNEEGALVRMLYERKDPELVRLLHEYRVPADYDNLKSGIYKLIQKMPEYRQYVNPPPAPQIIK